MNCLNGIFLALLFFMTSLEAHALSDSDPSFEDIINAINLYQEDWKIAEIGERIYINPLAIVLQENQITLVVGPFQVPIPSLYCDSYGIYMDAEMCMDGWLNWKCCKCLHFNSKHSNTCQKCFNPKC